MLKRKKRQETEVNASSMADIAFLLLIFFLVTTTIASDKGLPILLPPEKTEETPPIDLKMKNIFKVIMNSNNQLLVEDNLMDIADIRKECKIFLSNRGKDPKSSDSPQKAIVSIKTDRGTSYELYIDVMDEVKAAYHELRAEHIGITSQEYLELNKKDKKEKAMYTKARKEYPLQISEAEPTDVK